jgi:dienelactone hydrolase
MLLHTRRGLALLGLAALRADDSQPIRNKAEWQALRKRTLAGMCEVMGPLPDAPPQKPAVKVVEEVGFPRFTRKKITFDSGDGDFVPAYLFVPIGGSGRRRAALCLHQTVSIGKDEPAGLGGKPNLRYAVELAERGFVTIAPDYPKYGEYKIDPYEMGYVSATMKGIRNHRRAVDVLVSMPEVDSKRIAAIGHSLGGHNALFVSVFDTRVAAVVTSCGFTAFPNYKGGDLTGWSHAGYMPRIAAVYGKSPAKMPFDFPAILQSLAPRFVFINAPTGDSNFDLTGVQDCVKAAQPVYSGVFHAARRLRVVHPECGHDFPPDVRMGSYEFLRASL